MVDATPQRGVPRLGPTILFVGSIVFVVGCFLPLWEPPAPFPGRELTVSLYRLNVTGVASAGLRLKVGGFVSLFAGIAVIASITIAHVTGRFVRWSLPALVGAAAVWSPWWIGTLLRFSGIQFALGVGYWLVLVGVGLVAAGTIVCVSTSQTRFDPLSAQPGPTDQSSGSNIP